MKICPNCGERTRDGHETEAVCIAVLQRRNANDRQKIVELTTAVRDIENQVSRLCQRVEVLAVQRGHQREELPPGAIADVFKIRRAPRLPRGPGWEGEHS